MTTRPVAVRVSQATRLVESSARQASRMASEIWSAILSGWPSVTDSEVNKQRLVGRRIARALEQQCGILLVIAVDHDSVEVLAHQLLDCSEWFRAGLDVELELA